MAENFGRVLGPYLSEVHEFERMQLNTRIFRPEAPETERVSALGQADRWRRLSLGICGLWCYFAAGCGGGATDQQTSPVKNSSLAAAKVDSSQQPTASSLIEPGAFSRPAPDRASNQPAETAGNILQFDNVTSTWNVSFNRFDDIQGENRIMEVNGGGIAILDYDLDGWLDLFFTQGAKLPIQKFNQNLSNELFRNQGVQTAPSDKSQSSAVSYQNVTTAAEFASTGYHTGCAVGDINADGFPDVYINAYGRCTLWLNLGDGTFRDVGRETNSATVTWGASVAIADLNGDGFPEIYNATYLKAEDDPPKICKNPASPTGTSQCPPTLFPAVDDVLLVNNGEGQFVNLSQDAGILLPDGKGLGVLVTDLNGDNQPDIHIANDGVPSFLFLNATTTEQAPAGSQTLQPTQPLLHTSRDSSVAAQPIVPRFLERGMEFGVALNGEGRSAAAMGIAHGDYDRDGWTDLYVTNFYLEMHTLYHNQSGQGFVDYTSPSRLGPPARETLAFGTEFLDIDHDGWLDLIVTTGHIEDVSWNNLPYRMLPHLFRNERNGRFTDVAKSGGDYFTSKWVGRPLAIGDLDRDGDLDVVIGHQGDPSVILANTTPEPETSVIIKPVGANHSSRDGVGTRITASQINPPLFRDLAGGGSFQSASAQEIHLPLADARKFKELVCTWADGEKETWNDVGPGYYVAIQGQGLIRLGSVSR